MFTIIVDFGKIVFRWLYRFVWNGTIDGSSTASWRTLLGRFLGLWILFNVVRNNLAGSWYSLNFKEPWTTDDYPALCSDGTAKLLPWMSSEYPALKSPASNIRLLHLHPSSDLWGIEATLEQHSFLERPQYTALSYTWGDPAKVRPITVNGKRMNVTENLWNALFHIRDAHRKQVLWVDAISINQDDNEEKSIQVPLVSFIYSRAREVLIWLGDYKGPRWVEQADLSNYHGDWAVSKATDYWSVTKYWLYALTQEEYWKRCWIVQEVAMASRIRLLAGRSTLPWSDFISLLKLYKSKVPLDSASIDNVLRLDILREAKYVDGTAYSLERLLETFGDCFCTIPLDKIFAFVGMASDCLDGCLNVDYSKSPLTVYQDLIKHWNSRCLRTGNDAIGTARFAALVRSILSRKSILAPKVLTPPSIGENADSFLYLLCGDDRAEYCSLIPTLRSLLTWVDLVKGLSDRTLAYLFPWRTRTKSLWLPSGPETRRIWTATNASEYESNYRLIRVRGAIAGTICDLGPMYREFVEGPQVPTRWAARLGTVWGLACNQSSMSSAKAINERLNMLLGPAADYRLRNFVSLDGDTPYSFYSSRLFIGFGPKREVIMGLAPSQSLPGDLLVQFWETDAVLVARERGEGEEPTLVGRAGIVKDGGIMAWGVPTNRHDFEAPSDWIFDHLVSISVLTQLTLDTIHWPDSNRQFHEQVWDQPKDTWTSHDFESKDINMFSDGNGYDNVWHNDQVPHIDELHTDDLEKACLLEPCRLYSSRKVGGLPIPRRLNLAAG